MVFVGYPLAAVAQGILQCITHQMAHDVPQEILLAVLVDVAAAASVRCWRQSADSDRCCSVTGSGEGSWH